MKSTAKKKVVAKTAKTKPKAKKKKIQAKTEPIKAPESAPIEIPVVRHGPGRPPKYKTVQELETLINNYFDSCWTQKIDMFGNPIFVKDKRGKKTDQKVMVQSKPYTIVGLALAIGTTRETLLDYENKDAFSDTIKRAKQLCHGFAEEQLYVGKNPTGAIFNLKNNYGWKEKSETEHSGGLTWTEELPK